MANLENQFGFGDPNLYRPVKGAPTDDTTPSSGPSYTPAITTLGDDTGAPVEADPDVVRRVLATPTSGAAPKPAGKPTPQSAPHARYAAPQTPAAKKGAPPPPPPPPPPATWSGDWWKDVGKTAATQAALGVSDIPALPGTVTQGLKGLAQGAGDLGTRLEGMFGINGFNPQNAAYTIAQAKKEAQAKMAASERAGDTTNIFGWQAPTSQGTEKYMRSLIPSLGYAPKTQTAKVIGAGARMVPMALTAVLTGGAGLEPLAAEAGTMFASGAGSELAGQAAEKYAPTHPNLATAARIAGAFAAPGAANLVGKGLKGAGEALAEKTGMAPPSIPPDVASSLSADLSKKGREQTIANLKTAAESGAEPGVFNAADRFTHAQVRNMPATPEVLSAIDEINEKIANQKANAAGNVAQHISDSLGLSEGTHTVEDPYGIQQEIKSGNQPETTRLYKTLETDPAAQSVQHPSLHALSQSDLVNAAGRRAASAAKDPGSKIIPQTEPIPGVVQPGNIFYWDTIKRELQSQYNMAARSGDTATQARIRTLLNGAPDNPTLGLIPALDEAAPNYAAARNAAADSIGGQNAVENGYMAFQKKLNSMNAGPIVDAFKAYSPEEQELFQRGAGSFLKETALRGGPDAVAKIVSDPIKGPILRQVLGDDHVDSILGRAQSESMLSATKAFQPGGTGASGIESQAYRALAMQELPRALGSLGHLNPLPLLGWGGSFLLNSITNGALSKMDEARALRALKAIGSTDPAVLANLAQTLKSAPKVKGALENGLSNMRDFAVRTKAGLPTSQNYTNPNGPPAPTTPEEAPQGEAPQESPTGTDPTVDAAKVAIAGNETGGGPGGYQVVGKTITHPDGTQDRAVGRYQVMESNIPAWTEKYYGKQLTPEEFRQDPEAQERVFEGAFGDLLKKYKGNIRDAMSAWHSGVDLATAIREGRHDINESTQDYVQSGTEKLPQGHADGGRIERASGGRIEPQLEHLVGKLMSKAKTAKKMSDDATKPLLRVPDEAVVKALSVAQQAI